MADVDAQVAWLRSVFGATGDVVAGRPAELRIGDSLVMVTEAGSGSCSRPSCTCTSTTPTRRSSGPWQRVRRHGAPLDTPYGDRRAMVRDPFGNVFQIAHRR